MCRLQAALGRWNRAGSARVKFGGHTQCATECLEHGFALMMRIFTAQIVDMQRDQRVIDEALEKLARQIDVETANHRTLDRKSTSLNSSHYCAARMPSSA